MKLKKSDLVKVVLGKDKGKTGKIEKVFSKENKVLVTGVNQYKRHLKASSQGQKSEIVTITKPMPVSNVIIICPNCKKTARIGFRITEKSKVRICKRCGKEI